MIPTMTRLASAIGITLILVGCGKQADTGSSGAAPASGGGAPAATAPTAALKATTPNAPGAKNGNTPVAAESLKITRINEDGSESVEETGSDSGVRNPLLTAVAASFSASASAATTLGAPTPWQEGVNYTRLVPAQPTSAPAGQVEVIEFFWYSCPHCNAIDPLVEAWKKTKQPYIQFTREHVMWQEPHRAQARLFYTLQSMGKLDELHAAIFHEIHVNMNPLIDVANDPAKSEDIQAAFVAKHGVSAAAFKNAYHSFAVETAMQRGDQLWNRYRISGVPTFVVNGKYVADVGTAKGEEQLLSLVSDLAALEHKR